MTHDPLLQVKNLHVSFSRDHERVQAVRDISFSVRSKEVLAIVGESGCGKSVTAQALMRLLPENRGTEIGGSILFDNSDLLDLAPKQMRALRGCKIGMIFQDPMTSLNPTMSIGRQIEEVLAIHLKLPRAKRRQMALELLRRVGIYDPERRARQFPHEFSGGMRQRVVIAIGIACGPKLLIADEPTTALDVTVQAQILELFRSLLRDMEMSLILITHDLGVVAAIAHSVIVMYAGQIMEWGSLDDIFYRPAHPYTKALLRSLPTNFSSGTGRLNPIEGQPPHLSSPPSGCPFTERCEKAMKICPRLRPDQFALSKNHIAACHLHHPDREYWSTTSRRSS